MTADEAETNLKCMIADLNSLPEILRACERAGWPDHLVDAVTHLFFTAQAVGKLTDVSTYGPHRGELFRRLWWSREPASSRRAMQCKNKVHRVLVSELRRLLRIWSEERPRE